MQGPRYRGGTFSYNELKTAIYFAGKPESYKIDCMDDG